MTSRVRVYLIAIAALVAAVGLRALLDPLMGDTLPLVTLFGGVAIAVWAGGFRPALFVAVAGYAACHYFFIEPRWGFGFSAANMIGLAAYIVTCALIIGFGETMRAAQAHANDGREVLRVTLRSIGDGVITTDTGGRVTYLNEVAEALTGWSRAEAIGQPLDDVFRIVNEATRQTVENPATKALRQGIVVGLANHTVLLAKDGVERPIDDSSAPIKNEDGLVSGCVLIFRDATEQRRIERERAEQLHTTRLLAAIVESSDDAIISKTLNGIIQSWNGAAERVFGYTAADAIGRHISLIIPPDRIAEEDQIIASLKAERRVDHFETERMTRDGRRIWVSLTISPIKDAAGNVIGASKIARDVTAQRLAEAERARLAAVIESSTDFIGISDLQGVPFFINRAGLEMVGLDSIDDARQTSVGDFFFPEDRPRVMHEFLPKVLADGRGEIQVRFRHFKNGPARWMAYKVIVLTDAAGRPNAFATVSQDVTERKRLEDNLLALADNLSQADRRKDEFLAMLAHELRNPLAPISNAVHVLRHAHDDAATVRSASLMLERHVAQLSRLVDDLLDVSRITRGKIELRKEPVELAGVIQHVVESARALFKECGHQMLVTVPAQPITVEADPTRLAQIITNLVNNACKFTDPGGRVWVTVEREGDRAVIRVRDSGIGIAAEHLPRVFEMFTQVDSSLERSRDGLGIGLTLVKTLSEMHGGTVEAHSDGPGRGSEFVVRLPVMREHAPIKTPAARTNAAAARRRRILIVDDNADSAESLALLLSFRNQETFVARDGAEAVDAAERLRPDAVLLDIGLPKLNGYEACRRIRERPWGQDIALIALTGLGTEDDRQRSHAAGFDAHIVKPVDPDNLMALLDTLPDEALGETATADPQ